MATTKLGYDGWEIKYGDGSPVFELWRHDVLLAAFPTRIEFVLFISWLQRYI